MQAGNTLKGRNMNLNYNTAALLKVVSENRENHIAAYEDAVTNYKKFLKKELEKMLAQLADGKLIDQNIKLRKPECHTKEYDKAIKMLTMTSDKEIELDEALFTQLVMDDWHWQRSFAANTMVYSSGNVGIGASSVSSELFVS